MTKDQLTARHAALLDALKLIEAGNAPYRDGEAWAMNAAVELRRTIVETLRAACEASE